MAKDLEKLAKQIFNEFKKEGEPVTMEEALEMAKQEIGAKEINLGAREKAPSTEKKSREVKVSQEKIELFDLIWEGLYNFFGENAEIVKHNKEISVKLNDKSFKIDIVEHRNKK